MESEEKARLGQPIPRPLRGKMKRPNEEMRNDHEYDQQ
jgi:hypothetical protein